MKVRFGFVAMSMSLQNASPSGAMTYKAFQSILDRQAALEKATRIAERNLHNTLRILRHARASGIFVYRFSSKLIPLLGHPEIDDWDFIAKLKTSFQTVGEFVKREDMRVSFHPEHFTLLNSPKREVTQNSILDLSNHVRMLEAMGLGEDAKLVLHVGGGYRDKEASTERFLSNWETVPSQIQKHITLENDDKTFTAKETQAICNQIGVPNVFDVHHHACNHEEDSSLEDVVGPFLETWLGTVLAPKAHVSSSKSTSDFRAHADFINPKDLLTFLDIVREQNVDIDVMLEAKQKDEAVFKLMKNLKEYDFIQVLDGATILYRP